jgi:hypothetical protein
LRAFGQIFGRIFRIDAPAGYGAFTARHQYDRAVFIVLVVNS